jgi:hypothetical protein
MTIDTQDKPSSTTSGPSPNSAGAVRSLAVTTGIAAAGILALLGVASLRYGSLPAAVAAIQGRAIVADATTKSLGDMIPDRPHLVDFTLTNLSSRPVRIVGVRSSCSCVLTEQRPPLVIESGRELKLRFSAVPQASPPEFLQEIRVYTDVPSQPAVALSVTGRVVAKPGHG